MGLFSSIKKIVKKVIKGVKKVFSPILKPLGKLFGSKWGKIILIAAAVFTAGMALYAGWTAAAATQGSMMSKFLTGSKAFLSAVVNPVQAAKGALGNTGIFAEGASLAGPGSIDVMGGSAFSGNFAGGASQGAGAAVGPGDVLTEAGSQSASVADVAQQGGGVFGGYGGPVAEQAGAAAGQAGAGAGQASGNLFKDMASKIAPREGSGLLTKSGNLVKSMAGEFSKFGKTTGGGLLLSNMMQGYSQGKIAERQEEERERREAKWADSPELDRLREVTSRRLQAPQRGPGVDPGLLWKIRQGYSHQPPIPYSSGGG